MNSAALPIAVPSRTATSATPMCIVTTDGLGEITHAGANIEEMVGIAPARLVGSNLGVLCKEHEGPRLLGALTRAAAEAWTGTIGQYWLVVEDRADLLVEMFLDSSAVGDDRLTIVLRDVTAQYIDEQKARGLSEHPELVDQIDMALTRWTPDMTLAYHSPEFEPLVVASAELLRSHPALTDVGFTQRAQRAWHDSLRQVIDTGDANEFDWETDDNRQIRSRALAELGGDGFISSVLVVSHDVTQERARYEELTRRALFDPLTGLANRATTHAYIQRSLGRRGRTGTSEALIFIDLDRFKSLNDSLGHAAGDDILRTVAKRLTTTVRPHDVVGRLGGDEFVIYLEQMEGIDAVLAVVDRVRDAISGVAVIAGHELRLRASMGVAFASGRDETPDSLIAKADAAMYKAKGAGRDCVELYDDELRRRAEQRTRNERALQRAMRNGEMEVHFLPEFDLESRQVVGAEALLRWQHPRRGLIPAAHFVGLAEETGQLIRLGNEVLRRSCEMVSGWLRKRNIDEFTLRVNISPKQLAQPTLAPFVEDVLETTKLDPQILCLELAEATLTERGSDNARQLRRLRDLGLKVSVDDFGTAASSLVLLKEWPIDMLKIDMSFVQGLGLDPRDDAIVEAILNLGEALHIDVVAEGIDNGGQLAKLIALGCRRGQGYGLSQVVRPEEFLRRFM